MGRSIPPLRRLRRCLGFSLIELLIVIGIVGLLAGAAVGVTQNYLEEARITRARADLDRIAKAAARLEQLEGGSVMEVRQLLGRYIDGVELDPWGRPYYVLLGAVHSRGPDGIANTPDDIVIPFRGHKDERHRAWREVRELVKVLTHMAAESPNTSDVMQLWLTRDLRIPLDPWNRPYFVHDGWMVSAGASGDPSKPGGAWTWIQHGHPAPVGPDGKSFEVPAGVVPSEETTPPVPPGASVPQLPVITSGKIQISCNR